MHTALTDLRLRLKFKIIIAPRLSIGDRAAFFLLLKRFSKPAQSQQLLNHLLAKGLIVPDQPLAVPTDYLDGQDATKF